MSVYAFFESFIEENPELTKINYQAPLNYEAMSKYYMSNVYKKYNNSKEDIVFKSI